MSHVHDYQIVIPFHFTKTTRSIVVVFFVCILCLAISLFAIQTVLHDLQVSLQGVPKKRIPNFIFGITSVIQHRFQPFFHCYKQKFMACKLEVLPPTAPLLCDHIT